MSNTANEKLSDPQQRLMDVAQRHQLSVEAIDVLHRSLLSGGYHMAQFNHSDLGGMGQWSNGMIMIGDFSNSDLKQRVKSACEDLTAIFGKTKSSLLEAMPEAEVQSSNWWPKALGAAASTGAQNNHSYAYFPAHCRLAVKQGTAVTIFDTGEHQFFGATQEQGLSNSLSFESQHGRVDTSQLKVVEHYTC